MAVASLTRWQNYFQVGMPGTIEEVFEDLASVERAVAKSAAL
jgi:hypothetical protein